MDSPYNWEFVEDAEGDDQAPVLNLTTEPVTVYLDEGIGTLSLEDDIEAGAEDNCSEAGELVYSFDASGSNVTTREFGLDDRGEQTVALFVSDAYGNAASEDLTVTVVNTATDIVSFTIPGQSGETVIDTIAQTIDLEMPFGTDLSLLSPVIGLSAGASSSPASNSVQNFTNTVSYIVTAEDGRTQQVWTVTVTEAAGELSSDTDIVSFTFAAQTDDAVINYQNHTVVIEVTFGTALNGLIPTITLSDGASASPESGVARDFTDQVSYTVTAEDGSTEQVWTVTVTEAGNGESAAFTITPIADVTLQENSVYTSVTPVLSGDEPKGTVTWTLGGADAAGFSINGSTGVVTMIARDFEAPADVNTDNVYEVSITATDSERNSSETSWTVTVQDDPFEEIPSQAPPLSPMIPTAFTPNGDGANDTWIIDQLSEDASVRIYDRHGTILFRSDEGYTRPWDGSYRGSGLPAGPYLYLIQNGPHTYRGSVTILL